MIVCNCVQVQGSQFDIGLICLIEHTTVREKILVGIQRYDQSVSNKRAETEIIQQFLQNRAIY